MGKSKKEKSNVIFILSDDQGIWASGCYGNKEIRTPNIDSMAKNGVRFENFFVATPVCSPSRATFLTGKISSQHGVHDWIHGGNVGPGSIKCLEGETAYTDILADNGYICGLSGKWHLGDSQRPQHGFSHWFAHQLGAGDYYNAPMVHDGELINVPGYISDAITDDAINFIEVNKAKPFYLSIHYTAPHSPWIGQHPKEVVDSYDDCPFNSCPQEPPHPWAGPLANVLGNREALKGYFAAVTAMDYNIGRISKKIEELGLREKTLIVFASDNGFSCGHHGFWGKGNGTVPRNMYENSIKVPFIISHSGKISQGKVMPAMVSNYDFMPTLLEYLNLPIPEDNYPGRSFLPLLLRNEKSHHEFVVVFDEYGPVRMIRTREWKYVHRYPDGASKLLNLYHDAKCVHKDPDGPNELYNLIEDPDERNNLVNDPGQKKRIEELKGDMEEWFAKYVIPEKNGLLHPGSSYGQNLKQ